MDLSEPLNQGQRDQRRAEGALRSGNICEAIKNFQTAAEKFNEAEAVFVERRSKPPSIPADRYVVEALSAQHRFCLRQVELLTVKLEQLKRQEAALMEQHKKQAASGLSNLDYDRALSEAVAVGFAGDGRRFGNDELKQRLIEKIKEQDSLLGQLEIDNRETATEDPNGAAPAAKCPKSDRTVIEELRQCNEALRQLIVILLNELESKTNQVESLKKALARAHSPSHRQRASTTPTKMASKGRKRADSETPNLPELPPLEFPSLRAAYDRESF